MSSFPSYKDTGTKDGAKRVLTDSELSSFYDGRQFRTFWEFAIAAATTEYMKVVVPVDSILRTQELDIDAGGLRFSTIASVPGNLVTETTPFSTPLTAFRKNNMTRAAAVTPSIVFSVGGVITGGLTIDVKRRRSGQGSGRATVGGTIADIRGVAPATYYFKFENIDNIEATGVYSGFWEELPARY